MKLIQPLSSASIQRRLGSLFSSIERNLSAKLVGLPGSGKSTLVRFACEDPALRRILKISSGRQFLYLDLVAALLSGGEKTLINEAEKKLKVIKKQSLTVVLNSTLLLGNIPSFQLMLAENYLKYRPNLNFIFLFPGPCDDTELIKLFPLFKIPLEEAKVIFPLFAPEEIRFNLAVWEKILSCQFKEEEEKIIANLSGGLASLIKSLALLTKEKQNLGSDHESLLKLDEITGPLDRILQALSDDQKIILKEIAQGKGDNKLFLLEETKALIDLGIIIRKEKRLSLFSPFLTKYLLSRREPATEISQIAFNDFLTPSPQRLLDALLASRGRRISRDQAGEAVWRKNWEEKYSDWALDQIVSQIRKKMTHLKDKKRLVTLRGIGFELLP